MKIFVLNTGSGSQRCSLFDLPEGVLPDQPAGRQWEAKLDSTAPDQPTGKLTVKVTRSREEIDAGVVEEAASVADRTEYLLRMLWEGPARIVRGRTKSMGLGAFPWQRTVNQTRSAPKLERVLQACRMDTSAKLPQFLHVIWISQCYS